jgi:hypothetical protein
MISTTRCPTLGFVELSDAGHTATGDDNDAFTEAVTRGRRRLRP